MPKIVNEGRRVINNVKNSSSLFIMKTLLILVLSIVCLSLQVQYFFEPNNMLMFEMFVSALPSTVLSLQPNNARVKGKFIPYVLSRAIPGALTIAVGILTLYVIHATPLAEAFGFVGDTPEFHALMMCALTFCGLVMLYRISQPFNILRAILFILATTLCVLVISIPVLGEIVFTGWTNVQFTLAQVLLMVIIVQLSFPLSKVLISFFDMINPVDE